jgi:hypothetical protein
LTIRPELTTSVEALEVFADSGSAGGATDLHSCADGGASSRFGVDALGAVDALAVGGTSSRFDVAAGAVAFAVGGKCSGLGIDAPGTAEAWGLGWTSSRIGIDLPAHPPSRTAETTIAVHFMHSLPASTLTCQIPKRQISF